MMHTKLSTRRRKNGEKQNIPAAILRSSILNIIQQSQNPSIAYLIFEKPDSGEQFGKIDPFLSRIKRIIRRQEIFHDQPRRKYLLAVQFASQHKDMILQELIDAHLPEDVTFSIYTSHEV